MADEPFDRLSNWNESVMSVDCKEDTTNAYLQRDWRGFRELVSNFCILSHGRKEVC